jgi:hypothetical protein
MYRIFLVAVLAALCVLPSHLCAEELRLVVDYLMIECEEAPTGSITINNLESLNALRKVSQLTDRESLAANVRVGESFEVTKKAGERTIQFAGVVQPREEGKYAVDVEVVRSVDPGARQMVHNKVDLTPGMTMILCGLGQASRKNKESKTRFTYSAIILSLEEVR